MTESRPLLPPAALGPRLRAPTTRWPQQMVNFVYAIGDRATGECLLVDPAYAVDDLIAAVGSDGDDRDRRRSSPTTTPTTSVAR